MFGGVAGDRREKKMLADVRRSSLYTHTHTHNLASAKHRDT